MMFVLGHFHIAKKASEHIIIDSSYTSNEMIELTSAIEFLYEFETDLSNTLPLIQLEDILCSFYNVKRVDKKLYLGLQKSLNKVHWNTICTPCVVESHSAIHIDLYEAREFCCGDLSNKIMNRWLPKGENLQILRGFLTSI